MLDGSMRRRAAPSDSSSCTEQPGYAVPTNAASGPPRRSIRLATTTTPDPSASPASGSSRGPERTATPPASSTIATCAASPPSALASSWWIRAADHPRVSDEPIVACHPAGECACTAAAPPSAGSIGTREPTASPRLAVATPKHLVFSSRATIDTVTAPTIPRVVSRYTAGRSFHRLWW